MIAALYVKTGGSYFDLPGVDPWGEARDARKYAGPHPVVATALGMQTSLNFDEDE